MTDRLSYPDPSILPEKCRDCPSIGEELAVWTLHHAITNGILQYDLQGGATQEEIEAFAAGLSPLSIEFANQAFADDLKYPLDPSNSSDRQELVRILIEPDSVAYRVLNKGIQQAEAEIRAATEKCEGKGPINLRVPDKQSGVGSIIVSLCRNDVGSARSEPSVSVVRIRREPPRR